MSQLQPHSHDEKSWWSIFVRRPVATSLLTIAIALPGLITFHLMPISTMPMVDLPTISVQGNLPGGSPETMASSVATPLERTLGRIAGITEITSSNSRGTSRINIQFELEKDVNTAAREVQAAINAAASMLPSGMLTRPGYKKSNTAGPPLMVIALTSASYTQEQLYEIAFTDLGQKVAQVSGVGEVDVRGSSLRAVRVEINPQALNHFGINLDEVRTAIANANPARPTGFIENRSQRWQIDINDSAHRASDFAELIVSKKNNGVVRLKDIASVEDSVQEVRSAGIAGTAAKPKGIPAVMLAAYSEPNVNIVEIVDNIKALLPRLREQIPAAIDVDIVIERSKSIRETITHIEHTLIISIALVVLVTFLFLRSLRATLITTIAIPVTLLGTISLIYLCGFSLNNLSLMALIIATSFVVDDAIVVVENVSHHIERGLSPIKAALQSLREVGFTMLAMNLALVAVLTPLLFMGGLIGRLFREFSLTLALAIFISLLISLTTTPMLCAKLLKRNSSKKNGAEATELADPKPGLMQKINSRIIQGYDSSLRFCLNHSRLLLSLFFAIIALNVYLYQIVPKGFFPQQDTSRLFGNFQFDQNSSFEETRKKTKAIVDIIAQDPAIETFYEFAGGSSFAPSGAFFAQLKPLAERKVSSEEVIARLRPKINKFPGATLPLTVQQDLSTGARPGSAAFQYTLFANDFNELRNLMPSMRNAFSKLPEITDVNSDYQEKALQVYVDIDREAANRLGVSASQIDNALNNAFGQRAISTLYEPLNQYFVVLNLAPNYTQGPQALENIYVQGSNNRQIPLASISSFKLGNVPLTVNHQEQFVAATISFNLAAGVSLEKATKAMEKTFNEINTSPHIRAKFAGTAKVFQDSLASQPWLILSAIIAVYILLGILYESTIHPLTILSSLPAAGVGALLALIVFNTELSLIAFIGVILVLGIVMKNAIIMINCALQLEQQQSLPPLEAISQACALRFRPIMMTSIAAILGALPLALGLGDGGEIRRPLGISIIGGLLIGQALTLYTTPVIYLYLDRLRHWSLRRVFKTAATA
ncbi:MAG TPA: efflux RND transporter permease subunit [Cellvibrio sp.]|nr:efflux RND transporter permease subunit [Cellvibrio sp.]